MEDFDEGTENLVGKYAQELYETGRFNRVNIKALAFDGFEYMAVTQDDKVSMIINDESKFRIGDPVLVNGGVSPPFLILSTLLGHWDKAWKKLPRKPWHTAFLTRKDENGDWWVGEAKGGVGVTESRLDDYKEPYLVFRWFDTPPDEVAVAAFMQLHWGKKYDSFWGYFFTILWFFLPWFPRLQDDNYMCWEFLYIFCVAFGKPLDEDHNYPFITIIMTKLGYPGY